ncbi:MAG: hypothetical protein OXN89_23170 [Bryobacterales bacterium]|nr:hypothetical protein [Bryobacterales bacterium]
MPFPAAEGHYPDGDGRYLSQSKVHLTTVSQLAKAAKQHRIPREHGVAALSKDADQRLGCICL